MWKLLKFFGHLIKGLFWMMLLIALCAIILLYILENGLPQPAVRKVCEKISDDNIIVQIDRITYSLSRGLRFHGISAEPRKLASESFGTAEDIIIDFSISPFIENSNRITRVTLQGIEMPHHPRNIFRKLRKLKQGEKKEPEKPRKKIPTLEPFKLTIENSNIIGLEVAKTTAVVAMHDPVMKFTDVTLKWPDTSYNMQIKGEVEVNLDTEILNGAAKGETFPENLLNFLAELEADSVIREINLFSEINTPIKGDSKFDASLKNGDFAVDVAVDIHECAYRKVPLLYARGFIQAWGTNTSTWVKISDLSTANKTGTMEGNLFYDEERACVELKASSTMDHNDVVTIIDILTHGELDPVKPVKPLSVTASGVVSTEINGPVPHNLNGKITMGAGEVFGLRITEATSDFRIQGDHAYFDKVSGTTPSGGIVLGDADFTIPPDPKLPPLLLADVDFSKIDLSDLAKVFSITNSKAGECSGKMQLSGIPGTNQLQTLNGEGSFEIINGQLNRLRLFAGLTDYLTKNVPGVSSIVDQSSCSLNFIIKDGILSSRNFSIEGDVFSVKGKGTYDIAKDNLDFVVHVGFFKEKTIAGRISRIVTFPFKKLLLEFKVFGSIDNPDWSYVNILEKIVDQIPEKSK